MKNFLRYIRQINIRIFSLDRNTELTDIQLLIIKFRTPFNILRNLNQY